MNIFLFLRKQIIRRFLHIVFLALILIITSRFLLSLTLLFMLNRRNLFLLQRLSRADRLLFFILDLILQDSRSNQVRHMSSAVCNRGHLCIPSYFERLLTDLLKLHVFIFSNCALATCVITHRIIII